MGLKAIHERLEGRVSYGVLRVHLALAAQAKR
jgi:hypothetical protein